MIISVTDNLKRKIEPLSYSDAAKVAALIRQNAQDVNLGEYTPAKLERLNAFATPEKIQEEVSRVPGYAFERYGRSDWVWDSCTKGNESCHKNNTGQNKLL